MSIMGVIILLLQQQITITFLCNYIHLNSEHGETEGNESAEAEKDVS